MAKNRGVDWVKGLSVVANALLLKALDAAHATVRALEVRVSQQGVELANAKDEVERLRWKLDGERAYHETTKAELAETKARLAKANAESAETKAVLEKAKAELAETRAECARLASRVEPTASDAGASEDAA